MNIGIPNNNFAAAGSAVGAGYIAATSTNVQIAAGAETRGSNTALIPMIFL